MADDKRLEGRGWMGENDPHDWSGRDPWHCKRCGVVVALWSNQCKSVEGEKPALRASLREGDV